MNTKSALVKSVFILSIFFWGCTTIALGQFHYQNTPLSAIISDIEEQTSFRFLYRDALIADIRLTFSADSDALFAKFRNELNRQQLALDIDSTRNKAIIFKPKNPATISQRISVRGQVVDASTGERLPFATITWKQHGQTTGVSSNKSGAFLFQSVLSQKTLQIQCSYVGYSTETITLNFSDRKKINELTFRLQPNRIDANELVVTGTNFDSDINKQASDLVDMGTFSPMGESNSLRALQTLPSVSLTPAMSDGLNVRGSPSDGFQVLVDDITIYNQSHLFGLVDSFNSDILQQSGFYYDIAPAQIQAPPGGTLSLYTKSGNLHSFSGSAGLTNSAARISLEGPIKKGKSSWLISGRTSYMNAINWMNNADLMEWGLNVDRDKEVLDENLVNFESQLVRPDKTKASFFDLHGKLYFEGEDGGRFILSGYWGGDNTRQDAKRLNRSFSTTEGVGFESRPVSTTNDWQNVAGSAQYNQWFGNNIYSSTTLGVSIYQTYFSKDDFTYIDINQSNSTLETFVFPFENESILNELKAEQQLEFTSDPWYITGGASYHYYIGEYLEDSFDRPGYSNAQRAHQADLYAQVDYSGLPWLNIFSGTRLQYYSTGDYLLWSPRIKIRLFPKSDLSVGSGFSKNHQFLNKVSLSNTVTSDVWVLAEENHPPTSVDYVSAGIYYDPSDHFFAQIEGYHKTFENLRLHEINTFSLSNTFNNSPWYNNNNGTGQGIEFLLRNQLSFITLTQTLTVSEMTFSNPQINNGDPFYADWDRTYRYSATLTLTAIDNLHIYLSWMYASGTSNKLATFGAQNEQRLGSYQRADLSADYTYKFSGGDINLSLSVFNLLDRKNPWYRELAFVIDQSSSQNQFRSVPVDVYDIGFQPSFNISVQF